MTVAVKKIMAVVNASVKKVAGKIMSVFTTLDLMEYSSNTTAQAAYPTNSSAYSADLATDGANASSDSNLSGSYLPANAFDNTTATNWISAVTAFPHWIKYDFGAGNEKVIRKLSMSSTDGESSLKDFTFQGSNNNTDWTTLHTGQQANNTSTQSYTFANTVAYRYYRVNTTSDWGSTIYVNINEIQMFELDLQDYSEATIKNQGSYSLKGVAHITGSLNKTLTRTVSPTVDLSNKNTIGFYIYASRTGANIKIGFHDAGGTTTEVTPTVNSANTWEYKTLDISAVTNANKDAIDSIIITIVNADATNTFYIDNVIAPSNEVKKFMGVSNV